MVLWEVTAVSGLSFCYSSAAAVAIITAVATAFSAATAATTAVATTTAVTGLFGLSCFPASVAITIPAANQLFTLIPNRLLREPIFKK